MICYIFVDLYLSFLLPNHLDSAKAAMAFSISSSNRISHCLLDKISFNKNASNHLFSSKA